MVFAIVSVAVVIAQARYFRALADRGHHAFSDADLASEILDDPKQLLRITARATAGRLTALVTRQDDPDLERRRLVAVAFVVLTILAMIWGAVAAGR